MSSELDAFLREGLDKYREAKDVVELFEREITERIQSFLDARRGNWGVLKPKKVTNNGPGTKADNGRYITAFIAGSTSSGRPVEIDLGVWWGARGASHKVIVYACFWKPSQLVTFNLQGTRNDMSTFRFEKGTILQSPVPEDLNLGRALDAQVEVLLEQLRDLEANR